MVRFIWECLALLPWHSSAAFMKPFNAQIRRQVGSSTIYIALNTHLSIAAIAICSHYLTNQPKATKQIVQQTTTLNATLNIQYEKKNKILKENKLKRQQIPQNTSSIVEIPALPSIPTSLDYPTLYPPAP